MPPPHLCFLSFSLSLSLACYLPAHAFPNSSPATTSPRQMCVPGARKSVNEYRRELSRGLAFSRKRKTSRKKLSSFERRPPQVFFFFFPLSLSARFLDSVDGNSSSKKPPFFSGANRHYSRPVVADNAKLAKPARSAAAVFLVVMRRRRLAVRVCDRGHRRSAPADGRRGSGSCGLRRRSGRGGRGQGAVGAGERREDAPGEEGGRHGLELAFFFSSSP